MSVVANIAVNLDATQATRALQAIGTKAANVVRNISTGFETAGNKLSTFGGKIQGVGSQLANLGTAAAGLGAGALVKNFAEAGIAADRTNKTINALAGTYGEVSGVQNIAANAAKQFGIGQTTAAKGVADLYGRLRPMGISLDQIGSTFNGVNKAAALMNLTAADTDGVLLQLSQAMGSGALQGDELRSVMERLPAVGQAIAKVMGVTVGEIKQLGADGMITTEVIVKAMDELNKLEPPPPDPYRQFQAAMEDLQTSIGTQLLPILAPLATKLGELATKFQELQVGKTLGEALMPLANVVLQLVEGFLKLDPGMQKAIIQFAAIAIAVSLILVPIGLVVGAIGTLISAVGGAVTFLAGAGSIGAVIAGWAGAVGPAVAAIISTLGGILAWVGSTLIPGLLAFFSGPVGWTVLAVAAVVAMAIAFREPIMKFFNWLGNAIIEGVKAINRAGEPIRQFWIGVWSGVSKLFDQYVVKPLQKAWQGVTGFFSKSMSTVATAIGNIWRTLTGGIKNVINTMLRNIANSINTVGGLINKLIDAYNRLADPDIPRVPTISVPQFAQGGYVTGPTLAMVGEGGEPEYIIPESKMAAASASYLAGNRGGGIIDSNGSGGAPVITINTGPVMEFNGQKYVTLADMERAMRKVSEGVIGRLRTPSARTAIGAR